MGSGVAKCVAVNKLGELPKVARGCPNLLLNAKLIVRLLLLLQILVSSR